MKAEKFNNAFIAELRSASIYSAAVAFFAAGYLCHMYSSADGQVVQLIAWYRVPISIAILGLPAFMILNSIIAHILELRKKRIHAIEDAEKNITHQFSVIDHQKEKLNDGLSSSKELMTKLETKQQQLADMERKLKTVENQYRQSTNEFNAWAEKVAKKVEKSSATLFGSAAMQAPEQVKLLKQNAEEIVRLLDSAPKPLGGNDEI